MSARSWMSWASRCGPGTIAPGRCTAGMASRPAPALRSTCTTPVRKWMPWPRGSGTPSGSSGRHDGPPASGSGREAYKVSGHGTHRTARLVEGAVMELESLYQEIILDHYRHPHHKGLREPYNAEVHHVNPLCGDEVTLRVMLKDAGGEPVVADISYDALGCSISQASVSMMADAIIGKTVRGGMDAGGAAARGALARPSQNPRRASSARCWAGWPGRTRPPAP